MTDLCPKCYRVVRVGEPCPSCDRHETQTEQRLTEIENMLKKLEPLLKSLSEK